LVTGIILFSGGRGGFIRGFWEKCGAGCGVLVLMVKWWWIRGNRGELAPMFLSGKKDANFLNIFSSIGSFTGATFLLGAAIRLCRGDLWHRD
jgi:hypothetical protein